jgi:hypothetical protein
MNGFKDFPWDDAAEGEWVGTARLRKLPECWNMQQGHK